MMMETRNYTTDTQAITITATAGGASSDVLYTCPPHHDAEIDFLHVSNGSSSTRNFTLQWYHNDNTTYYHLVNDKAIAGKDVYNVVTSDRIYLHAGDKITAFVGASASLSAFISVRQFFNPSRTA
tara:strand:- start:4068 stop:4442 length:375 start_codon:yes stop_codon:yes gene_type:complete